MKRVLTGVILVAGVTVVSVVMAREPLPRPERLVAHEWGTFTSVANDTGEPAQWAPWSGPADLPCFVHSQDFRLKWSISGLVRMETPVIYFYAPRALKVSVDVDFPKGLISEWYPAASVNRVPNQQVPMAVGGAIHWKDIEVIPGAKVDLPKGSGASHYYAARETDAAPVKIGEEKDKLLFYRGVGSFAPPLRAWYPGDGKLWMRNAGPEEISSLIVFENHGDKVGYRVVRGLKDEMVVEPPQVTTAWMANLADLYATLQRELVASGLYEKEAKAMIETWKDSWFEKGTRVFYIVPRSGVEPVLPLKIAPQPAETVRVFVARMELLSPWMEKEISHATEKWDIDALRPYGRFLPVFAKSMKITQNKAVQQAQTGLQPMQSSRNCVE